MLGFWEHHNREFSNAWTINIVPWIDDANGWICHEYVDEYVNECYGQKLDE